MWDIPALSGRSMCLVEFQKMLDAFTNSLELTAYCDDMNG